MPRKKKPPVPPHLRKRWTLTDLKNLRPEDFAIKGPLMNDYAALARIAGAAQRQFRKAIREHKKLNRPSPAIEHFKETTVTRLDQFTNAKAIQDLIDSGEVSRRGVLHDILAYQNLFNAQTFTVEGATQFYREMSMRITGIPDADINWNDYWRAYDAFISDYGQFVPLIVGGTNTIQSDIAHAFMTHHIPIDNDFVTNIAKHYSEKYGIRMPGESDESYLNRTIFAKSNESLGHLGPSDIFDGFEELDDEDDDFPF